MSCKHKTKAPHRAYVPVKVLIVRDNSLIEAYLKAHPGEDLDHIPARCSPTGKPRRINGEAGRRKGV